MFKQLLEALEYLHGHSICHRDIKCSNLLVSNNHVLKLADFGLARNMPKLREKKKLTNRVITLWYRPPELLLGSEEYQVSVDMWSAGCILVEMKLGVPVFQGKNEIGQLKKIIDICGTPDARDWPALRNLPHQHYLQLPFSKSRLQNFCAKNGIKREMQKLVTKLLTYDPITRLSARQARSEKFFSWPTPTPRPSELRPIQLEGDAHEWEAKMKRKRAEALRKANDAAKTGAPPPAKRAAVGGTGSSSIPRPNSVSVKAPSTLSRPNSDASGVLSDGRMGTSGTGASGASGASGTSGVSASRNERPYSAGRVAMHPERRTPHTESTPGHAANRPPLKRVGSLPATMKESEAADRRNYDRDIDRNRDHNRDRRREHGRDPEPDWRRGSGIERNWRDQGYRDRGRVDNKQSDRDRKLANERRHSFGRRQEISGSLLGMQRAPSNEIEEGEIVDEPHQPRVQQHSSRRPHNERRSFTRFGDADVNRRGMQQHRGEMPRSTCKIFVGKLNNYNERTLFDHFRRIKVEVLNWMRPNNKDFAFMYVRARDVDRVLRANGIDGLRFEVARSQ